MAQDQQPLSDGEADRIYSRRIRPDYLEGALAAPTPTAVVVNGQAGTRYASARIRAHLAATEGPAVVISRDDLREYHPAWRNSPSLSATTGVAADVDNWLARLISDATSQRINLILESSVGGPERTLALKQQLRSSGYRVATVALVTDRDHSRQVAIATYDAIRPIGSSTEPRLVSGHDATYDTLRETVGRVEADFMSDRVQLVTRDGQQLYTNQLDGARWAREPRAVYVLDDFRERRLTARELADSVLRWDMLVDRLSRDATVPPEVADRAKAWREEAAARAETDPDAKQLLARSREAQAFLTMSRYDFLRQFPHHVDSVDRMNEAVAFAETSFADPSDRHRFIAQTRARLAERIAEGQANARSKRRERQKTREPKSR